MQRAFGAYYQPNPRVKVKTPLELTPNPRIAEQLGVSPQAVHAAEKKALRKLREKIRTKLGRDPENLEDFLAAFKDGSL